MTYHIKRKKPVTPDKYREGYCPHKSQRLQDIMSYRNIGDMSEWTDLMIEDKIEDINDGFPNSPYHDLTPSMARTDYRNRVNLKR